MAQSDLGVSYRDRGCLGESEILIGGGPGGGGPGGGGPGGGPGEAVNGISQQPVTVKTIELRERVGKDKVKIRSINK